MNGTRYDNSLSSLLSCDNCPDVTSNQAFEISANGWSFSSIARIATANASPERPWRPRMYSCEPTKEENSEGNPNLLKITGGSLVSARNSATAPPRPPTKLCSSKVKI